jgi:hypothetical protein
MVVRRAARCSKVPTWRSAPPFLGNGLRHHRRPPPQREGWWNVAGQGGCDGKDRSDRGGQRAEHEAVSGSAECPRLRGLEVTKWLKDDPELKSIPIIAVTAFAMKGDEQRIREGGCEAYLSKPISVGKFMETVRHFLDAA